MTVAVAPAQYDPEVVTNLIPQSADEPARVGHRLRLASLAPRFDPARHQVYYDLLVRAIGADGTYNVALTGAYGTGKSSILGQLRDDWRGRVVDLSLSTTGPRAGASLDGAEGDDSRTNEIQKEIVKQLLYRLPPTSVPRSRFRRTTEPDSKREWTIAGLSGAVAFVVLFGLGLVQPLVETLLPELWRQVIAYVLLAAVAVGAAWVLTRLVSSRPAITASVNAAATTVTLSKPSETYFDKYLDEIVYFFEASRCDVVLIEDIDRFDDVQVFDTLRALNGLLNSSGQIGRRIVFVYAIRDSVFERIGGTGLDPAKLARGDSLPDGDRAKETLERAERTKFFDVIIPVVPFVSADNARDVMSEAMASDEYRIDPALIRLAARHVADMRLIHNVRNEFEVYRNRLVVSDEHVPEITDDLVFAIVLFKNTHLADFERFRHQDSSLDRLYLKWRALVRENLEAESKVLTALRDERHREQRADARSTRFGRKLLDLRDALDAAARAGRKGASASLSGVASDDTATDRQTWIQIASGEAQKITIHDPNGPYGYAHSITLSLTAADLGTLLGAKIDPGEWEASDLSDLDQRIAQTESRIAFLRHHTWADLHQRPEFTLPALQPASEPTPNAHANGKRLVFDELAQRNLESDLARDLVRHGFLTPHFALYASSYYGTHLGRSAMEYIRRFIEPGTPDPTFSLDHDDVAQILREQGAGHNDAADVFSDPSIYNTSIVNYLLKERPAAAAVVARRLSRWGEQEQEFVQIYSLQGESAAALLSAMAPTWPSVVQYAAVDAPVDSDSRMGILNAVLKALPDDRYTVNDDVRQVLETAYQDLDAVTSPATSEGAAIVFRVIRASGAILDALEPLNPAARDQAVEFKLYPVTSSNLHSLTPTGSIALDRLLAHDNRIYGYALERLSDYLTALNDSPTTAHSVSDATTFETILNDAAEHGTAEELRQLISLSSDECRVPMLEKVTNSTWPFLVTARRTDPTFANTKDYIDKIGGVDEHLGALLADAKAVTEINDHAEEERQEVAVALLAAVAVIPSPAARVRLAESLEPGPIPGSRINPESGDLVARLLRAGLLADDETAFEARLMVDWATYEQTIAASKSFETLVSPALLDVSLLPSLIRSAAIRAEVKRSVVNHLTDYLVGATGAQAQSVARALNDRAWKVRYERIEALRAAGADAASLIGLIAREAETLETDDLKALLRAMGEPYSVVADRGKRRPTFIRDDAHATVLERLKHDTISSFEPETTRDGHTLLRVNLLRPRD